MPWAVASAFAAWGLGLTPGRWKPHLCLRLGLPAGLGYEYPPYHAAMALGAVVLGLRFDSISGSGEPWWARPWVPAALAVLVLLMLKLYPHRGWIDGFIGLLSGAVITLCGPGLDSFMAWGLVILILALLWRTIQWAAAPRQEAACQHLGIPFVHLGGVASEWSLGLLAAAALPLFVRITRPAVLSWRSGCPIPCRRPMRSSGGKASWRSSCSARTWISWPAPNKGQRWAHTRTTATLLVWWLAIPASPLVVRLGLDPASVLPLATGRWH